MKLPALLCSSLLLMACSSPSPKPSETPRVATGASATKTDEVGRVTRRATGEVTFFLMADLNGVLRPCGCTVDLQKGGFDRLIPWLGQERARFAAHALLHAGPLFYEKGQVEDAKKAQRERQVEVAADLLAQTEVTLAGASSVDELASEGKLKALSERAKLKLTAANLTFLDGSKPSRFEISEMGGLKVGVFALAESLDGVKVSPAETAAREVLAELKPQVDVVILLSGLGLRETKRLVRQVEGIDFAIAGGMGEHPAVTDEAELVAGTRVVQFHKEGRYVGRLTVRLTGDGARELQDISVVSPEELAQIDARIAKLEDATRQTELEEKTRKSFEHHLASLRDERGRLAKRAQTGPSQASSFSFTQTPLNWDLPQDPTVKDLMAAFDAELAAINIAHAGTLPEPKPGQAVYVGQDTCLGCHTEVQHFWDTNAHAKAWSTLEKLGKTFDAECVSCHVTGYGQAGGALVGQVAGRENVQCEACHGPGSLHVESTSAADILTKPGEETCVTCHNAHHSPRFEFGSWRQRLLVPGHGLPPSR